MSRVIVRYHAYLNKRCIVNPKRGPFHFRAPSRILARVVRGMVPHKSARGAAALRRFKAMEGVPAPYDTMKRLVVPQALRVLRLKPGRKFCSVGRLSAEVGWKYHEVVSKLEEKRKIRGKAYYEKVKALNKIKAKAEVEAAGALKDINAQLAVLGH
jgi:large subunit ribosomal protein L13Ae